VRFTPKDLPVVQTCYCAKFGGTGTML